MVRKMKKCAYCDGLRQENKELLAELEQLDRMVEYVRNMDKNS